MIGGMNEDISIIKDKPNNGGDVGMINSK